MDDKIIIDVAAEVMEGEEKSRRSLAILLDHKINTGNKLLVQKIQMGKSESFIGSVTLDWLASNVQYASSLPILKSDDIEMKQQREIDWSRQEVLVRYLVKEYHKFAPILAVQTRDWVYREKADEWGDGKALVSTIKFEPLDSKANIGLIDVGEGTFTYALDGQHRLMAIKGLLELISTSKLTVWNKEKTKNKEIKAEDLKIGLENLQTLKYERIGVEFIQAVCVGEKKEQAFIRVKSVFTHLNKYAKKTTNSEQALLDQDSGFALVARKCIKESAFLNVEGEKSRVDIKNQTIKDDADEFTSLYTVQEMARVYLTSTDSSYSEWEPSLTNETPERPDEDDIVAGKKSFLEYLNYFTELPSLKRISQGEKVTRCRKENNLLFRAIGQEIIAECVGVIMKEKNIGIETIFKKLKKYDEDGGFKMDAKKNIWYRVIWEPDKGKKGRINLKGRELAKRLALYLIGGGLEDPVQRENLRKDLARARTSEDVSVNFDGRKILPEDITLPNAL